jgi:hypothetical protein
MGRMKTLPKTDPHKNTDTDTDTDTDTVINVDGDLVIHHDGHALRPYVWHDRPCWLTAELSQMVGRQAHRRLRSWLGEERVARFIPGLDYERLKGRNLLLFKHMNDIEGSLGAAMDVLFEPGVHAVLAVSSGPANPQIRRAMVERVFPRLAARRELADARETATVEAGCAAAREADYAATREVVSMRAYADDYAKFCNDFIKVKEAELRAKELELSQGEMELREREIAASGFELLRTRVSGLPEHVRRRLVIMQAEALTGVRLRDMVPDLWAGADLEPDSTSTPYN